ncbi:hypothetical protein BASA50_000015 [Batrachochytrium salamandrivorans]|uniref:CID domain-containing protein n=1 Tax=Batrachochytrium salamandrivorans TaxID=1357716 RepID=A0ABQ8EVD1_9FUNG|nr:hypothetical protein BASA62_001345 [Batrachochytrium salamandrivorans]KAH6576745.1 hypothetical protein BASA60_004379 [Batrachochytrium salamandrivorans]KAH6586966.1 hypothetical protein BASA50_000015 [Batrachochytrium salamandrivorans]KAH6589708.1 hypothetical protein BASA61_005521 [Batrachochytrium salamandrivorans]KAH9249105.1 hypothetical protein BASA81_013177 [Batrachochytrium salamandrivorans]
MSTSAARETMAFDKELHALAESKLPVSASRITALTKMAMVHIKLYKNIVHSIEKFVQKCKPDYKLAGLYVIDSIVRASLKSSEKEKSPTSSPYLRRFEEKLESIFTSLVQASSKDQPRMKRVIALWVKSNIFNPEQLSVIDQAYFPDDDNTNATTVYSSDTGFSNPSKDDHGDIPLSPLNKRSDVGHVPLKSTDGEPLAKNSPSESSKVIDRLHTDRNESPGMTPHSGQASVTNSPQTRSEHSVAQCPTPVHQEISTDTSDVALVATPPLHADIIASHSLEQPSKSSPARQHIAISEPEAATSLDPLFDFDYGDEDELLPLPNSSLSVLKNGTALDVDDGSFSKISHEIPGSTPAVASQITVDTALSTPVNGPAFTPDTNSLTSFLGLTEVSGLSAIPGLSKLARLPGTSGNQASQSTHLASETLGSSIHPPVLSDLESISASMFSYTSSSSLFSDNVNTVASTVVKVPSLPAISSGMYDLKNQVSTFSGLDLLNSYATAPTHGSHVPSPQTVSVESRHVENMSENSSLNIHRKRSYDDVDAQILSEDERNIAARIV